MGKADPRLIGTRFGKTMGNCGTQSQALTARITTGYDAMAAQLPGYLRPYRKASEERKESMDNFRHKAKRGLAVFLALTMCVSLMQVPVFAVEEDTTPSKDEVQTESTQAQLKDETSSEEKEQEQEAEEVEQEPETVQTPVPSQDVEPETTPAPITLAPEESSEESEEENNSDGEEIEEPEEPSEIWNWDADSKTLTISNVENLDQSIVLNQLKGLNTKASTVENLTIDNVDTIAAYAFYKTIWTNLTTVTISNVRTIGEKAFMGLPALQIVSLTNVENVGTSAEESLQGNSFAECKMLTSLTLNNVGFLGAETFRQCSALTGPLNLNKENVTTMGRSVFSYCTSLTGVDLNDVTLGKSTFYACAGLVNVTLNNINDTGYQAFYGCTSLKNVTMGSVNTIGQYAFQGCSALETIDSLSNVSSISGFAFYGCSSLKGLTVADFTKMGYIGKGEALTEDVMKRIEAILSGKFQLDDATKITELSRDTNTYPAGAIGQSENWNQYDNGTQLMEQARWLNTDTATAEVKVDAYYTGEQQMDYIFVADLSASMAQLGNPEDNNARFYDMQSKLLDMTDKLLSTPGYDCKVAIVTFGGFHNNSSTQKSSGFMTDAETAREYILGLEPLNENTDYKLGLNETSKVLASTSGRNTSVIFLSDGQPTRDGEAKITDATAAQYNAAIAALANQIKGEKVNIYGVLHSPASSAREAAMTAMNAVCGEGNVYASNDTESFGQAMNAAFTAAYGNNTVTIPVNAEEFDVSDLKVSAGETEYNKDTGIITWTLNGMPFTDHSLTYNLTLKEELANRYGTYQYSINNGDATFGENAASVGLDLTLSRTLSAPTASVSITPSATSLTGGGAVTLTVNGPQGTTVSADPNVSLTNNGDGTYTVTLPNSSQEYTFTASFPGNDDYAASSASCVVAVTYQRTGGGSSGGSSRPTPPPTVIEDPDVPLAGAPGLNNTDHFAYIAGYSDGTVRPTKDITRAEVATIFLRLMTEDFRIANWSTSHSFNDAGASEWYNIALAVSAKADILRGYSDGSVKPNAAITRAEFATIAARFLGEDATDEGVGNFSDTGSHWAAKDIRRAAKAGWIKGDGNQFRPNDSITRAEVVTIVNRMLDRVPDQEHMLSDMKTWSDNPVGTWYYADVQEASNDHAYQRDEAGITEHWTELTAPKDWTALEAAWIANNGASAPKTDGK